MNHALLVQLGVKWLRKRGSDRCSTVFAEMTTNAVEQPDVIGWREGISHVIEAKVSRADFRADMKKPWMRDATSGMGEFRWYLAPADLLGVRDIPEWCGLLEARPCGRGHIVSIAKRAPQRVLDVSAYRRERIMLASACHRHELGSFFDPVSGCWETFSERLRREEQEAQERRAERLARRLSPAQLPLVSDVA